MNKFLQNYYKESGRVKPEVLVEDIETLTNLEWRKMRQNGIGGSDAGAIMNKSTPLFKSAFEIAQSKLEELDDEEKSPNDEFRLNFGHALEPIILDWYARTKNAHVFTDRGMYYSPKHNFMLADCDGFAVTAEGELIGLEIKTTSFHKMMDWCSGVYGVDGEIGFEIYYTQVQHYMSVMDIDRYDIVVAFGNNANDIKIVTVKRDKDYQEKLIQEEEYFWNNLNDIANQMPDFVSALNAKSMVDKLRKLNVKIDDKTCEEKCESILAKKERLADLKEQVKDIETSIEADKILLLANIKEDEKTEIGNYFVLNKISYRKGSIDTKKLGEDHPEVDLEGYRKEPSKIETLKIWEKGC